MSYVQNYSLIPPLAKIARHDQLPPGAKKIAQLSIGMTEYDPTYFFIMRKNKLSILISHIMDLTTGDRYVCNQYDFPLSVLSWFPKALEEFRRPPGQGGLHAGAMISKDEDVDGEMLAVGSTTRGYNVTNWSRDAEGVDADPDYYEPTTLGLDYELLYDHGLLGLWKSLGEKYERNEF